MGAGAMAEHAIPVDLFNPGQVFACLGLLEAAEVLLGEAEGGFDWSNEGNVNFHLRAEGEQNPVAEVLAFLAEAEVFSQAPHGSALSTEKWDVPGPPPEGHRPPDEYPFPVPRSPATCVALLRDRSGRELTIDHWGDATERDNVKFWAGAAGYPGAALLRDALDLIRSQLAAAGDDPFAVSAPQSSSFRFDWRRDYIPLEVGFSPNIHGDITMLGFPLVEILAAIGLGASRPRRIEKLEYIYGVIGTDGQPVYYPLVLLRAALGAPALPFPCRFFRMHLGWPGQENQARCILDVTEEVET